MSGDIASRLTALGECVELISGSVLHVLDDELGNGSTLKPFGCVIVKRGNLPKERGFIDFLVP